MQVSASSIPWTLDPRFIDILNNELSRAGLKEGGIITFRDPDYTPQAGGFHPVEVGITSDGSILYITDFMYMGMPPDCDLCKSVDFDFDMTVFRHYGMEFPLSKGQEMFKLWQSNFIVYHGINAYSTTVEKW